MKNLKNEWAFFVDSGTKVQNRIDEKMSKYVDTYKDVCFPVINRVFHFPLANLNCLLISKKFYEEVGEFEDFELPELTKLIWSEKAVSLGGRVHQRAAAAQQQASRRWQDHTSQRRAWRSCSWC